MSAPGSFKVLPLVGPNALRANGDLTARHARMATSAPRVPFDKFKRDMDWQPGEHVAFIGPTGQGKTNFLINLLPMHKYVVVLATKPRDKSMDALINSGEYVKMEEWRSADPRQTPRRVLWPSASSLDSDKTQAAVFRTALEKIYREGKWTVAIDELWFIINRLGLSKEIKTYLLQARALDISLVCATQRPVSVPVEVYDQSTHLFFWRDNDKRNQERLGDINARDTHAVQELVGNLDRHQVLYINTRTGYMCRTKAPLVKRGD